MLTRALTPRRGYSTAARAVKEFSPDELSKFAPEDFVFRWKNNEQLVDRSKVIRYATLASLPLSWSFGIYAKNEYQRYQDCKEKGERWTLNPKHVGMAFASDTGTVLAAVLAWRYNNKHNIIRTVKTVAASRRPIASV